MGAKDPFSKPKDDIKTASHTKQKMKHHSSNHIHPNAIIGDSVQMGENNTIEAFCVLEGKLTIGNNNHFGVGCITTNTVQIGDNNQFFPYVGIGYQGEMGSKGDLIPADARVQIGNNNIFREYTNIHFPVRRKTTSFADHCYIMNKTYLAHDAQIGNHVVMTAGTKLGGGCTLHDFAYIGMGAATHQGLTIGESVMVGMNAANIKNIPPFSVVTGVPSRLLKFNYIGVQRRGFDISLLDEINENFKAIIQDKLIIDDYFCPKIQRFLAENDNVLMTFKQ